MSYMSYMDYKHHIHWCKTGHAAYIDSAWIANGQPIIMWSHHNSSADDEDFIYSCVIFKGDELI